jgi:hypothetical protein
MSDAGVNSPLSEERHRETRLRDYARGMAGIGVMIHDLRLAIGRCGEDELYDDLWDPLGRAARLVGDLEEIAAGGRRLAEGDRAGSPTDPSLARALLEGADRLSRELPMLTEILAHHQSIRARRSSDQPTFNQIPER